MFQINEVVSEEELFSNGYTLRSCIGLWEHWQRGCKELFIDSETRQIKVIKTPTEILT